MNTYTPDKWVIIKITVDSENHFKVLGGWSGGYLDGDSWRINSGITKVETHDDHYIFHGHSGSVYKCLKSGYGINKAMAGVLGQLEDKPEVEVIEDKDFKGLLGD